MKINEKYYAKTIGEAFHTEEVEGRKVEFFYMNEQPYYQEFINKGTFFFWTTGKDSARMVVEQGYYEAMKPFFSKEITKIQFEHHGESEIMRKNVFHKKVLPLLVGFMVLMFALAALIPEYYMYIMLGFLVLYMFLNGKIRKYMQGKMDEVHKHSTAKMQQVLGKKEYKRLLKVQDKYKYNFFKFDDDEPNEETKEDENGKENPPSIEENIGANDFEEEDDEPDEEKEIE